MLAEVRISAEIEIPAIADDATVREKSGDAALVFIPLRLTRGTPTCPLTGDMSRLVEALPRTAMIRAAEDIDLDAEPEEGHEESEPTDS